MTTSLPPRPASGDVDVALGEARHGPRVERTLAAELLHLRACIEKCKSVQRVNDEAAKDWRADVERCIDAFDKVNARARATIYSEVSTELAKALEGF